MWSNLHQGGFLHKHTLKNEKLTTNVQYKQKRKVEIMQDIYWCARLPNEDVKNM